MEPNQLVQQTETLVPQPINEITEKPVNIASNQTVSKVVKNVSLASNIYQLLTFVPFAILIILALVYLISKGVPWYVGGLFIFFIIVMLAVQIKNVIAISSADLNKPRPHEASKIGVEVDEDEKITGLIAGILKTGFGIRSNFSFLRAQVNINDPQNAILITNKHIHLVWVPIFGSDQNITSLDLGIYDFVAQRKNILDKLNQMIATMTLSQILQSDDRNFSLLLSNIQKVTSSDFQHAITFVINDNQKFSYSIRDNEDYQKLKQIFHA